MPAQTVSQRPGTRAKPDPELLEADSYVEAVINGELLDKDATEQILLLWPNPEQRGLADSYIRRIHAAAHAHLRASTEGGNSYKPRPSPRRRSSAVPSLTESQRAERRAGKRRAVDSGDEMANGKSPLRLGRHIRGAYPNTFGS